MGIQQCLKLSKIGRTWQEKHMGAMCACAMIALTINNLISNGTVKRVTIGWMFGFLRNGSTGLSNIIDL